MDWERCIAPRAGEWPPLAATTNVPTTGEEAGSGESTADAFVPVLRKKGQFTECSHEMFGLLTSA